MRVCSWTFVRLPPMVGGLLSIWLFFSGLYVEGGVLTIMSGIWLFYFLRREKTDFLDFINAEYAAICFSYIFIFGYCLIALLSN